MTRPAPQWKPEPSPLPIRFERILHVGCVVWLVAALATWTVPAWRTGAAYWWPSVTTTGLLLGLLGVLIVRRSARRGGTIAGAVPPPVTRASSTSPRPQKPSPQHEVD